MQGDAYEQPCEMVVQVLTMEIVERLVSGAELTLHVQELANNQPQGSRVAFLIFGSQQYFR